MNIAIIIPTFNEEITIKETVSEFHRELPEALIFVIDNFVLVVESYNIMSIMMTKNN